MDSWWGDNPAAASEVQQDPNSIAGTHESLRDFPISWAIVGAITLLLVLGTVISIVHAKIRTQKGLPLLAYHRWLGSMPKRNTSAGFSLRPIQKNEDDINPPPAYESMTPPPPPTYQVQTSPRSVVAVEQTPVTASEITPSQLEQQSSRPTRNRSPMSEFWNFGRRQNQSG